MCNAYSIICIYVQNPELVCYRNTQRVIVDEGQLVIRPIVTT